MDVIRKSGKLDPRVASRYTVVLAAAKRARQLTEGAEPLTYAPADRAVSIAVKEMSEGKLRIKVQEDLMDGSYERLIKDQYKYRAITALSRDDLREDLKDDYSTARTYKLEDEDDNEPDAFAGDIFEEDKDTEPKALDDDDDDVSLDDFDLYDELDDNEPPVDESFDDED